MNDVPKKRVFPKWMKVFLILVGLALVCVGIFLLKSDSQIEQRSDVQATEDITVETPFCTLHYPGDWGKAVKTKSDDLGYGYVVRFYGTSGSVEAELFSVMFGYGSENANFVGTITRNGISTEVNLEMAELAEADSWTTQDAEQIRAMQAAADYIVEKLNDDPFFNTENGEESKIEIPDSTNVIVDTKYCALQFPAQWRDSIHWEILTDNGYDVVFNCTVDEKEYKLFTFSFGHGADNSIQIGVIKCEGEDVEIYLTLYDAPSENNWTVAQQNLFTELQAQAYFMQDNLHDNPNYASVME